MSRRDSIRMSDGEVRDFLSEARTVILTSIGRDGFPHPMPMWFAIDDGGAVLMTTFTKSQKIRNLKRDPRISLLVEAGEVYSELRGVVMSGMAELIADTEGVVDILAAVSARSGAPTSDAVRAGMRGTAEKRTGIRVQPAKTVSWDHRKLGGVY